MYLYPHRHPPSTPLVFYPAEYPSPAIMSSIQGLPLEVTVVGCNKLKDTEWMSRQDPYVCVEYASSKFRTRTCTDGHKDPIFQEKFVVPLIEGLRELNVIVWNSNTLTVDDFIGTGRVQLQKVISQGYDDNIWQIQSKNGRYSGEVRLIMHFQGAKKSSGYHAPPSPTPATPSAPCVYVPMYYSTPGPHPTAPAYTPPAYHFVPPAPSYAPRPHPAPYPNPSPIMPTPVYHSPQPSPYPAPHQTYPPAPYPHTTYPPPPQASPYPPGPFPGVYPPPY